MREFIDWIFLGGVIIVTAYLLRMAWTGKYNSDDDHTPNE